MLMNSLLYPKTKGMTFYNNSCATINSICDENGVCKMQPCYICKEKCQFSYVNVNLKAICTGDTGGVKYTNVNVENSLNQSPINFNGDDFSISEMFLLVPSIGVYGESTDEYCEFVIMTRSPHNTLNILIPVLVDKGNTLKNDFDVSVDASGNVVKDGYFELSDYIPQMPFVFYNTPQANYIVFPTSSLSISDSVKKSICKTQCTTNPIVAKYYEGPLYYNEKGPGDTPDASNQIYINCSPTDHSEEATDVKKDSSDIKPYVPPSSVLDKKWLFYIIVPIVIIIFCYITIKFLLYVFTPLSPKKMNKLLNKSVDN